MNAYPRMGMTAYQVRTSPAMDLRGGKPLDEGICESIASRAEAPGPPKRLGGKAELRWPAGQRSPIASPRRPRMASATVSSLPPEARRHPAHLPTLTGPEATLSQASRG